MAHLRNETTSQISSGIDYRLLPARPQSPYGEDDKSPRNVNQHPLVHDTSPHLYFPIAPPENSPQPPISGSAQQFYTKLKNLSKNPFPKVTFKSIFPEAWGAWRTGVVMCAFAAAISFLINTSVAIWATANFEVSQGIGTIYQGSCTETEKMGRWFHFGINALATILLSGSNYCMQCLVAPTRSEIDWAHSRGLWADIGVSSMRNFRIINKSRVVLWWCLAISSCPLHLIYNSAIFSSLASNSYRVTLVPSDDTSSFLAGGYINYTSGDPKLYQRLESKQCMQAYGVQFNSARKDVIIIVDTPAENITSQSVNLGAASAGYGVPYYWICGLSALEYQCDINAALANETWILDGSSVQYCLSERANEECSLQFSRGILIVVTICNAMKCICMILAALNLKQRPLITIGDAVSEFLKKTDPTTSRMCIASKNDFQKDNWMSERVEHAHETPYRTWHPHRHRWYRAVGTTRWLICTSILLSGVIATTILLCLKLPGLSSIYGTSVRLRSLWEIGFGTVDIRTFLGTTRSNNPYGSLLDCVIIANIAQFGMSTLYLLYNSIFTSMILADEWDRMSYEFKTLRVTQKTGELQRSSYFLTLPYKYSIPLMVASGGIHWLISQSIFLVRVIGYIDGEVDSDVNASFTTVGYSPIATICSLVSGCVILLAVFANGFRRYSGRTPLVGSCSAAISAACHPGLEGPVDVLSALQWGAVKTDGDIGHCTFSNRYPVPPPISGNLYAGTLRIEHLDCGDGSDTGVVRNRGRC